MADTRLVVCIVGSPERTELAEQVGALVRHLGRTEPVHRIRSRLLADRRQLIAYLIDRGIPGNARPLPVRQLHRVFETPLAGNELTNRRPFGAMRTAIDWRIPTRLLTHPHAIGDFSGDCAADRAMRADAFADRGPRDVGASSFSSLDTRERQGADRGETGRYEAGLAQETTAIETASSLIANCRCKVAATCLTFCSLDQHG